MKKKGEVLVPEEIIMNKIYLIRDQKVMLDSDLAVLYGVATKVLKQAVRRNIERFPEDFMFELTNQEFTNLRSQFVTSSYGGLRYQPMAFTEQGIAMLSSILKSGRAIKINIQIIRVFTKVRSLLGSHLEILRKLDELQKKDIEQDEKLRLIFEYINALQEEKNNESSFKERKRIGFRS